MNDEIDSGFVNAAAPRSWVASSKVHFADSERNEHEKGRLCGVSVFQRGPLHVRFRDETGERDGRADRESSMTR
jgi:hypothetical protein